MKKLKDIIEGCLLDEVVLGITNDSRKVKDGYIFVATKGYNVDHFNYIHEAVDNGAIFIVADREIEEEIPHIVVEKINKAYADYCRKFYDVKLEDFNFIGITGTDGKTTTASIVKQLLDNVAYIGTNGVEVENKIYNTNNTTPCEDELYKMLGKIKKSGCCNVVMEVSSEALLHKRLEDFSFEYVGFTNITEDHLNIHKTLENYRNCKFSLLKLLKEKGYVFINGDCPNCKLIKHRNKISFGFNNDNDYVIYNVKKLPNYVEFELKGKEKNYKILSPLKGQYNIYNVVLAFLICLSKGENSGLLIEKIKKLKPIRGRGEYLDFGQNFDVVLDYAHTYNGIKNILESVKNYEKIIVVTGAAGGREKEKRPHIGKLLLEKASIVIFTMDDPREENVLDIIDELIGKEKGHYYKIVDRKKAIKKAFTLADSRSVVLIIGKGRDNYMAIGKGKIKYSDYDVIKELLNGSN